MDAKISAIIPCYNVEKDVLLQCINSILQQDYRNYEIIIVDDGSDDSYARYIQEVAKLDTRIMVLNQDNQGVSTARNNGLKQATGDYVTFIDADDKIVPYFFSEACHIAETNNANYVVGCVYHTRSRNPVIYRNSDPQIIEKGSQEYKPFLINVTQKYSDGSYIGRGPVARLIKKNVLEGVFFQEDVNIGEDIIWNLDVISKCGKILMIHQIWYIYWENPDSITRKYNPDIVSLCEKHLYSLRERIDMHDEKELSAYCVHVGELLRDYVFGSYYGRSECTLPLYERYISFCKLCLRKPWALYETFFSKVKCDWKKKMKCLLIKFGLLYWVYYVRAFIDKRTKHEDIGGR